MANRALYLAAVVVLAGCGSAGTTVTGPAAVVQQKTTPFRGNVLPEGIAGAAAPRFALADARGGRFNTARLRGRPYAVTFLYTTCKDVCPAIAAVLRRALAGLGSEASRVAVVAVSADPETDTVPAVLAWLRRFDLPANFHYVIGSRSQLRPVWKAYYVAPQPEGAKESQHSASIWLIDARGRIATKYSAGAPVSPSDVTHDFRVLLDEGS